MQYNFEQNAAIVKQAFHDFLHGHVQGIINVCTDNIVWSSYRHPAVPYAGIFNGHAGVLEFFTKLGTEVEYKRFEPTEFYGDDNNVVVRGYHEGIIRVTGKPFGHDFMMHFRMREGKVYDYFVFVDTYQEGLAYQN